jgi:hypothetical protein
MRIRVVQDNLTTDTPAAALYETFSPDEARRLARKLEFRHTHARPLTDIVEIELSIVARQCLDRRLPDLAIVRREVD